MKAAAAVVVVGSVALVPWLLLRGEPSSPDAEGASAPAAVAPSPGGSKADVSDAGPSTPAAVDRAEAPAGDETEPQVLPDAVATSAWDEFSLDGVPLSRLALWSLSVDEVRELHREVHDAATRELAQCVREHPDLLGELFSREVYSELAEYAEDRFFVREDGMYRELGGAASRRLHELRRISLELIRHPGWRAERRQRAEAEYAEGRLQFSLPPLDEQVVEEIKLGSTIWVTDSAGEPVYFASIGVAGLP
jgi:hypothetical protein